MGASSRSSGIFQKMKGLDNEDAFVFIEKISKSKTREGKFDFFFVFSPVFIVSKATGEVAFHVYSDLHEYTIGRVIEDE